MKQRLGIAIALCGDPDFLVLDEPINGLDPQGIVEMRELILKLNRERQITVLISSHILDELSKLATHYGFIDGGRMVKEVSAQELEAACRKCARVEVSSTLPLTRVLDKMGLEYRVLNQTGADIYGELNITALVDALRKEGCSLLSVKERTRAWRATTSTWWEVSGMSNLLFAGVYRLLRKQGVLCMSRRHVPVGDIFPARRCR